jgi:CheY-like chemotaxis protein
MAGNVQVESKVGVGSVFRFTLDLKLSDKPLVSTFEVLAAEDIKVLVLGDITGKYLLTKEWCENWSMDVSFVEDVHGARKLLFDGIREGEPFNILIVDEIIGFEGCLAFSQKIRADAAFTHLSMIVITLEANSDKGPQFEAAGFNGYLARPVKEFHLYRTIKSLVDQTKSESADQTFFTPYTYSESQNNSLLVAEHQVKVLLVEDNLVNQTVAKRMLTVLGCEVYIASNGQEAVDKWKESQYDIIFMDCNMPILDGYQATIQIRESESEDSRVPIIALTANVLTGEAKICFDAGMDDFIPKPMKIADLEVVIQSFLRK